MESSIKGTLCGLLVYYKIGSKANPIQDIVVGKVK